MQSPQESLKPFANRIARAAVSGNAAQVIYWLRTAGLLGVSGTDPTNTSAGVSVADLNEASANTPAESYGCHVGIWERKVVNGKVSFVRRKETRHEWAFWADVDRIEPKSEKMRVLLIGESVARGYLYTPLFTPAMALQMILEPQFGAGNVEVIDLARMNLGFQIREVGINALQMEPDVTIIFAGNNWYITDPLMSEIAEIDEAISKQGIAGAKQVVEAQIARHARQIVSDLSAAYESKGIPLIWIIPEFNLRDWRDPITNAPYLVNGLNKEWLDLMEEAQSALRDHDVQRARVLAENMIEIDQGVCVVGFYILAECSRRANDLENEWKYLRLARDATSWNVSRPIVPRAYSAMQEAVRDQTSSYKNQVVDLPVLFREHLNGAIPDRRLFLDYCHLTTLGIQISMKAAASCVLRALKGIDIPWHALGGEHVAPTPKIEAEALLLAAILNAHCSQPYDVVHYRCVRALDHSRHIAPLMLTYMDLQTRISVPMRMSEAEHEIWKTGSPLMHGLLGLNKKRLDRSLLNAMIDALEEVGIEARERVERLCREEHSVANAETDLLDYYYCSAVDQSRSLMWLNYAVDKRFWPDAKYYQAYWPESKFIFVGEAGCGVHLCLTCRLPKPAAREMSIGIMLNGKPQGEIVAGSEWSTWEVNFPDAVVQNGFNEIVLCWPRPEFESGQALEKARLNLVESKFPDFYPIFGEIHSFTASDGRQVLTTSATVQVESPLAEVA